MGSVTSALTRSKNAVVHVGSDPESERSQSAPESIRGKRRSFNRTNVFSTQRTKQSTRQSLSEVLKTQESGDYAQGLKSEAEPTGCVSAVANEAGENNTRPLARFARSKSQNALWNAITAGIGIRDKEKRGILIDPRNPEEILADELPAVDSPDAMEKTAIRLGSELA